MSRKHFLKAVVLSALSLVLAGSIYSQGPAGAKGGKGGGKGPAAGQTVEKIRQLKPNLYLITGGGANTLVRVTPEGLIVADTKNPGQANYDRMMEEIRSVSMAPVKWVINTQHHPDHVGSNQLFIDAGAKVLAVEPLAAFMASDTRTKEIPGRPQVTFPKDYSLKLGGAEVQLHFFGPGHSGGDTMVYFPAEKIVMLSDQMTDATPVIDFANGGSLKGWNASLDGALAMDFDFAIPGRGEPKTKAEVQAYRAKIATLQQRAADAAKAGSTEIKTDDLGWTFQPPVVASMIANMK
ncbi:MAG: MBL fold metallo-hydrolase [Acidobacteriota bacterium]